MASYFYLMSSLPMLKSDGSMPITYEKFLDYCDGNVSSEKYDLLKNLTVNSSKGPLIKDWAEFYSGFHAELTYQRSRKTGVGNPGTLSRNGEFEKVVSSAVSDKNPLNAEKTLLELQFKKLDELIGLHSYDDYALFGYAMKLKLLERQSSFVTANGKAELNRLVNKLEDNIASMK